MRNIFTIIFIASLLVSCDFFDISGYGNFWANNFENDLQIPYKVSADLMVEGNYCNVWAEKGSGVSLGAAKMVADEFDKNIYNVMIDNFGIEIDYNMISHLYDNNANIPVNIKYNTMEFADVLGDNDGKLCILLLDIKDDYKKGVNDSYVAGYFWAGDLILDEHGSNRRDMIYIDTNPGMRSEEAVKEAFTTLAHEMQHLMNFVTGVVKRYKVTNGRINVYSMDIWIDEGLSSAAEYIYKGSHVKDRVDWFVENGSTQRNMSGLIDQGNNFFVWGNRGTSDKTGQSTSMYAILDDYSTVYLFFQWLRLQSNDSGIYKKIISSAKYDHDAVVGNIENYNTWDDLLKTWLAANYINAPDGAYGYKNDPVLKNIRPPAPPSLAPNLLFSPGEGVYSLIGKEFNKPVDKNNIKYIVLTKTDPFVSNSAAEGLTLLTFNANSSLNSSNYTKGSPESGSTTGTPAASAVSLDSKNPSGRFTGAPLHPLRIDATEMLWQGVIGINTLEWDSKNEE